MVSTIKTKCEGIKNCTFDISRLPDELIGDEMRGTYITLLLIKYITFLMDKEKRDYE